MALPIMKMFVSQMRSIPLLAFFIVIKLEVRLSLFAITFHAYKLPFKPLDN